MIHQRLMIWMALCKILGMNKIETIIESCGCGHALANSQKKLMMIQSQCCVYAQRVLSFHKAFCSSTTTSFEFQPSEQNIKSHKDDNVIVVTLSFAKQWGLSLVRKHQPPLNIN